MGSVSVSLTASNNQVLMLQERTSTGSQASVVALADLTQGELRQQLQPADYNVPAQRFGLPVGKPITTTAWVSVRS